MLFEIIGKVLFKYHTDLENRPEIADCYTLCKGLSSTVWLFPYIDFPVVQVDVKFRGFRSHLIPEIVHGAKAICVKENTAYFVGTYRSDQKLYKWEIGRKKKAFLGTLEGRLRGLDPSGALHFISCTNHEVMLYQVIG